MKSKRVGIVITLAALLLTSVLATRLIAKPNPGDYLPFPVVEAS